MLNLILIKLVLCCVRFGYDIVTHGRDIINMVRGRHRLIYAERKGRLKEKDAHGRGAVVAMLPNTFSLPFTVNLMKGLAANGFFVLGVAANKLSAEDAAVLLENCHVLIERFNVGRDFGSYKIGIDWIFQRASLKEIDTLALVNDSLFYPNHIEQTIADLLEHKGDWLALFENHQTRYHVQSFFEIFRKPVFTSKAFTTFWKKYRPFSSRTHAISKGELGLSRTLLRSGHFPFILYDSVAIQERLSSQLKCDNRDSELYQIVRITLTRLSGIVKLVNRHGRLDYVDYILRVNQRKSEEISNFLAISVGRLAETGNPTHVVGLICNFLFTAPVKRDICLRDTHALCQLMSFVQGFSAEERQAICADVRRRGLPMSFRFSWRGLKIEAGVE